MCCCIMLYFNGNISINHGSLLVSNRQEPVIEQWSLLDMPKVFYISNIVILIDHM